MLSHQPRICVVGSCNVDLITYSTELPVPGETIRGLDFKLGFGGKGANQCVMSAKLGANTVSGSFINFYLKLTRPWWQSWVRISLVLTHLKI